MKKVPFICLILVVAGCESKSTSEWIDLTKSKDSAQRLHAVKALAERTKDAATVVPVLADVLKDPDAFVRRDAAAALAGFGEQAKPAIPALLAAQSDKNAHVRNEVIRAIHEIDPGIVIKAPKK
jgi:HEAT repeat protein